MKVDNLFQYPEASGFVKIKIPELLILNDIFYKPILTAKQGIGKTNTGDRKT